MRTGALDVTVAARVAQPTPTAYRRERAATPWLLSLPALMLFGAVLLVPLAMTALLSLHTFSTSTGIRDVLVLANWRELVSDGYFAQMFLRTLRISLWVTLACTLLGAPEAYVLMRMSARWRGVFLLVILGPMLISVVARTLGWALLFGGETGIVNRALTRLGWIDSPIPFMFTETGVVVALAHVLLPFMVLSVWVALQRLDPQVEHAAMSLGASPFRTLQRVVLPQMMPGILAGAIIVFALAASAFATPSIIGGRRLKVASTLVYDEFLNTLNWPLGAAVAFALLAILMIVIVGANRFVERRYAQAFE